MKRYECGDSHAMAKDASGEWVRFEDVEALIAAARLIERGCDCEYDHRCGRCSRVVSLQVAVAKLDEK